jgi:hypothetical protein
MLGPVWQVVVESFRDSWPLIPILLPVYAGLEYFSHRGGADVVARLKIGRRNGPLAGTLLGLIPQCGMSVLVTSFYLLRRVTTGTLVATYLATSDEAIPVLLAHRDGLALVGTLILVKALTGVAWGYAIDAVMRSDIDDRVRDAARLAPESAIHMAPVMWRSIVVHGIRRTLHIFVLVFSITIALGIVMQGAVVGQALRLWQGHPNLQVLPVALFGLVPNCAVSVAIVQAFLKGGLSIGAAIAGLCVGAGFGPIVLLKDGDWRTGLRVLSLTLGAALVTGFLLNFFTLPR